MDVKILGSGDSIILLLHGWGMNNNAFDKIVGDYNLTNFKIIIPTFLGFGNSNSLKKKYDTYEYAYHIFLLLNSLGIDSVSVMAGHSFGGRIAILLTSIFDVKVERLVLTSSAGINRFELKKNIKIMQYKLAKFFVKIGLKNKSTLSKYGSSDYRAISGYLKDSFISIVRQDLRKYLQYISVNKCQLVWDKKDKITKYYICKRLYRGIKNSEIILYKNGGHFTYLYNCFKFKNIILFDKY